LTQGGVVEEKAEAKTPAATTSSGGGGGGGGKNKKKKAFTTKKKGHHKHVNVKLAVLKFYTVDGSGNVSRTRKSCPNCGVGIFMAKHFDRLYCGKCALTFKLDPSQIEKPGTKKKEEKGAEEEEKGGKKDAKKKAAKKK